MDKQQQQMSKEQALKILQELTSQIKLTRKEHEVVLYALNILYVGTESEQTKKETL
jgi:hypothetical protein